MTDPLLPSPHPGRTVRALLLPVGAVVLAAALRVWPLAPLGSNLAWLTFYPAVLVAALAAGFWAGLAAAALSCATVAWAWPLLAPQPFLRVPADYLGMAVFLLTGGGLAAVAESQRRVQARSEQAREALEAREDLLRNIANGLPGMVGYWDRELRCRFANPSYLEWFGKPPEEVVGGTMEQLLGAPLFQRNRPYALAALAGERQQFERTLTKPSGEVGHTLAHYIPDLKADGRVAGFFVLVTDVTPLKQAEAGVELAASVFDSTVEGIVVTDARERILSVNPAFTEITGFSAAEVAGRTPRILKSGHHDTAFYAAMWRDLESRGRWQGEIWNRRKDGEAFLQWQTITRIRGREGDPLRYVSVFTDITKQRQNEGRIRHLAFHDALTDLPNRALLMNRLDQQLAKAERERATLAVLFLDLDGFKAVNDRLGHDTGDELLRRVAQKLQGQMRQVDTVARLGGDEFVVLLDSPAGSEEIEQVAARILDLIGQPIAFHGGSAQVGVSIGIALFPADALEAGELIRCADAAMYAAKQAGRNGYRFFTG